MLPLTKIKRLLESFLELSFTKFYPLETHCFALTTFKQINYVDETATLSRGMSLKTIEYCTSHLYFLGIYTIFEASLYTMKIPVTCVIFHGIPQESVTWLFCTLNATHAWRVWEGCV